MFCGCERGRYLGASHSNYDNEFGHSVRFKVPDSNINGMISESCIVTIIYARLFGLCLHSDIFWVSVVRICPLVVPDLAHFGSIETHKTPQLAYKYEWRRAEYSPGIIKQL